MVSGIGYGSSLIDRLITCNVQIQLTSTEAQAVLLLVRLDFFLLDLLAPSDLNDFKAFRLLLLCLDLSFCLPLMFKV